MSSIRCYTKSEINCKVIYANTFPKKKAMSPKSRNVSKYRKVYLVSR